MAATWNEHGLPTVAAACFALVMADGRWIPRATEADDAPTWARRRWTSR